MKQSRGSESPTTAPLESLKMQQPALNDPWLVAVWSGLGAVSISAGYYLMAKLGMHLLEEFPALEFFDLDSVEVKDGLILPGRLPRSRLFLWHDPRKQHDLIVFIGEAQPPSKNNAFCSKLIDHARALGVQRVFTFAAMATQMRPEHQSRVFGAAIDRESLADFKRLNMELLEKGKISGLNGVLLGIAAEYGMRGGCLLGEMPHTFPQFPFPKASLAVLEVFTELAGITLDFEELKAHSDQVEKGLEEFLHRIEDTLEQSVAAAAEAEAETEAEPETEIPEREPDMPLLSPEDQRHIHELFARARADRSRAYELKKELDRLKVFHEYEDRFLDLFKKPD